MAPLFTHRVVCIFYNPLLPHTHHNNRSSSWLTDPLPCLVRVVSGCPHHCAYFFKERGHKNKNIVLPILGRQIFARPPTWFQTIIILCVFVQYALGLNLFSRLDFPPLPFVFIEPTSQLTIPGRSDTLAAFYLVPGMAFIKHGLTMYCWSPVSSALPA